MVLKLEKRRISSYIHTLKPSILGSNLSHYAMATKNDPPPPYPGPTPVQPGIHQQPYYPYQPSAPLNQGFVPTYGTSTSHTTVIVPPDVIIIGACPACRIGILEDHYTCFGLLCAIFFFPLGILCCLADKTRRCSNCGAHFD